MISKLLAAVLVFGLALWGLNQADILWFRSQVERLENDRLIYLSSVMRRGESDVVKDSLRVASQAFGKMQAFNDKTLDLLGDNCLATPVRHLAEVILEAGPLPGGDDQAVKAVEMAVKELYRGKSNTFLVSVSASNPRWSNDKKVLTLDLWWKWQMSEACHQAVMRNLKTQAAR